MHPRADSSMFGQRPCISSAVRIVPINEGLIAYDPERDVVHRLNSTAALILALSDGTHELAEIEAAVVSVLGDRKSEASVRDWLAKAALDGLVSFGPQERSLPLELSPEELTELVEHLHDQGETQHAADCQRRLTELSPDDGDAWFALGELEHELGHRETSRAAYLRYLEHQPEDAEVAHLVVALGDGPAPPRVPDECVVKIFDEFAESFDELLRGELEYRAPELLVDQLARRLPTPAASLTVADLGCGTGLAGKLLKPWSRHLSGVDLSPKMVERCQATGLYDELHVAELTHWLSGAVQRFDLMVACDVMIYFGDLSEILHAASRALSDHGLLGATFEKHAAGGFHLTDSGRYAHSYDYLEAMAAQSGLRITQASEAVVRTEYALPVHAWVVVMERRPTSTEA